MSKALGRTRSGLIRVCLFLAQWIALVRAGDATANVELVVQPEMLHPGEAFSLQVKVTNTGREDLLIPKPTPANVLIVVWLVRPDGKLERPRHHSDYMEEGDPSVRSGYVPIKPQERIVYEIDVSEREGFYPKAPGRYRIDVVVPVYKQARLRAERALRVVEPKDILVRKTWEVEFSEGSLRGQTGRVEVVGLQTDWFLFYRRVSEHGQEVIARLIEVTAGSDFLAVLSVDRINVVVKTNEATLGFLSVNPIDGRVVRRRLPLHD